MRREWLWSPWSIGGKCFKVGLSAITVRPQRDSWRCDVVIVAVKREMSRAGPLQKMTASLNKASSVTMEAYSQPEQKPWEAYCEPNQLQPLQDDHSEQQRMTSCDEWLVKKLFPPQTQYNLHHRLRRELCWIMDVSHHRACLFFNFFPSHCPHFFVISLS